MSESEEEFESADEGGNENKSSGESDSRGEVEEVETAGIVDSVESDEESSLTGDMATGVESLQVAAETDNVAISDESEEEEEKEDEEPPKSTETKDTEKQESDSTETSPEVKEEEREDENPPKSTQEEDTEKQESSNTKPSPEVPVTTVAPQESPAPKPQSSWGGWTNFGASFLSTATGSITTFTSHVGDGLQTVLETVENTMGFPHPEELAQASDEATTPLSTESEKEAESDTEEATSAATSDATSNPEAVAATAAAESPPAEKSSGSSWFSSFGINKLVSGSLGVLETVGRKTMDVISDTDPKLKKTRSILTGSGDDQTLAQALREAKSAQEEEELRQTEMEEMKRGNFRSLFEDMKGLAHFEALEILSKEAQTKVDSMMRSPRPNSEDGHEMVTSLEETFKSFEEDEDSTDNETYDSDFSKSVSNTLDGIQLKLSPSKLIEIHLRAEDWLKELKEKVHRQDINDLRQIHDDSIALLAEMTARAVEIEHKIGEFLLLNQQSDESLLETTTHLEQSSLLVELTKSVLQLINAFSTRATRLLNKTGELLKDPDNARNYITSVYLEASNSRTYVADAFQLLLPVFKLVIMQKQRDHQ